MSRRLSLPQGLLLAGSLLFLMCLASLLLGAGDLGVGRSLSALLGGDDADAHFVVFELRALRTELALLVGVALGAAGLLLQSVTRNPLAEPGLLGVSAGAAFAVVLAISLGASCDLSVGCSSGAFPEFWKCDQPCLPGAPDEPA